MNKKEYKEILNNLDVFEDKNILSEKLKLDNNYPFELV